MATNTVVSIGAISIDENYACDSWPAEGDKRLIKRLSNEVGGMISNVACNLACEGIDSKLLHVFAKDEYYEIFKTELARYNVDLSLSIESKDAQTSHCLIMNTKKDRVIFIELGNAIHYSINLEQLEKLKESRFIYSSISELKRINSIKDVLINLKSVDLVLDVEPDTFLSFENDQFIFDAAKIIIMNEFGYEKLKKEKDDIIEYFRDLDKIIIITMGSKGAHLYDQNQLIKVDGIKVNVIDSTGAGDMFNASFLASLIHGKSYGEALNYANQKAAQHTSIYGPKASLENKL